MRVAVVTGGASGIGAAVTERLMEEGNTVVTIDQSADATVIADLAHPEEVTRAIEEVIGEHQGVDILVNNAGFQHVAPIEEFDLETWDRMQAVMVTAPFLLTQAVLGGMKERRWGRIVNMASIHATVASPFKVGYVTAKHALIGLTKATAIEAASFGVTANAVSPAYVRTPLVEGQIADQAATHDMSEGDVVRDIMLQPAAIKRLIEPAEVAAMVAYLCSDLAGSVTGANWSIDLGWTAR